MIVPIVKEAEWLEALDSLPVWSPPDAAMLVVAPHPDDETLGTGGLIRAQRLRGLDVSIAAVTDGEKAYTDAKGLAAVRRVEQAEAVACLGVKSEKIVRFGLPDGGVASCEQELAEMLMPLVSPDTHLVAPWKGDFHADHEACGRAAEKVARTTGATLTSYFFWTWHFGTVTLVAPLPLRRFLLKPEWVGAKTEALKCHRSQLIPEGEDPVLPESLLGPARRPFEVFAAA